MATIARQYALTLFAIVARPWTWLMLGFGLLYVVPFTFLWSRGEITRYDTALVPVPVVHEAPAAFGRNGGELARAGRLATMRDWNTRWSPSHVVIDDRGALSTTDEPPGACPLLDRLPALERLWMSAPDMLSEVGWRRIGEHGALELLSLVNVVSPDAETRGRFPAVARAALGRLPRLRQLDLRGTGGSFELILPPLPELERCAIGWGKLDENLRSLADHSPRLRALGIETWTAFRFTPSMIESLRRMPSLRTVSIAAATRAVDETAMLRQMADLQRALPGVRVLPGTYRPVRIWTVFVAALLATFIPFVVWFMACVLLSTASSWMLPRRIAPHLFWPMAASAAGVGMLVGVARSMGAAWMPSLVLAVFAVSLGAYGSFSRDLPGREDRVTGAILRCDIVGVVLLATVSFFARPVLDRWLLGTLPFLDAGMLVAAASGLAWKLVRLARLPRILAEQGSTSTPGLTLDPQAALPKECPDRPDGHARLDPRLWWLGDLAIDRQIAAPVPADPTGVGGFADMLRRQHSRSQIPLMLAAMFLAIAAMLVLLPWFIGGLNEAASPSLSFAPAVLLMFAWQGCAMALLLVAVLWSQRRASLVVDFLRPVSRRDYWRAVRLAIARDLVLPALLGGGALGAAALLYGGGSILPLAIVAAVFVGCLALVHAMILVLAITKWPLVMGTLAGFVFLAAAAGSAVAIAFAMTPVRPVHVGTAWLAAGAVLAAGVAIRTGVVRGLEARELA